MKAIVVAVTVIAGLGATHLLVRAQDAMARDTDFVPLFNGKDLTGWYNINCARDTWSAHDSAIRCTGKPICELRTDRMYENFVLELEYQHLEAGGNAGVFVWADALPARGEPFLRAIEVQVLDGRETANYTSHGDVFAIHGARMTPDRPHPGGWMRSLPSERRARPAGQWNHYRITARNGTIKLAVNGKEVSGGYDISPRKGYIALESEGAPVLFRNIRIRELPSSGALPAEQIARAHEGFESLYDGQGFDGWVHQHDQEGHWAAKDWTIVYDGKSGVAGRGLVTEQSYGDFVLMADWRVPKTEAGASAALERQSDLRAAVWPLTTPDAPAGEWNRALLTMKGDQLTLTVNGKTIVDDVKQDGVVSRGRVGIVNAGGPAEFANVFIKTMSADGRP
jgi:hypothetical protein